MRLLREHISVDRSNETTGATGAVTTNKNIAILTIDSGSDCTLRKGVGNCLLAMSRIPPIESCPDIPAFSKKASLYDLLSRVLVIIEILTLDGDRLNGLSVKSSGVCSPS
jgi:hypothetical protein